MIQDIEEMDGTIGIIEKSEAEIWTVFRSVKMNGTEDEKRTELRLVLEGRHHQAKEIDLLIIEDVHLKTSRPK